MDLASSNAGMRPFGAAVDLDLDFGHADRPGLVTALLAQCGEPRDPAFWWSQPVGARTAALLRLVAVTEARDQIALSARCNAAACDEAFEFELPLRGGLPGGEADAAPIQLRLSDSRALTMRRPTGEDLRRWRTAQPASRVQALRVMLDSLVLAGEVEPDDEAALSASIAALDPLVDFTVACRCPACGTPNEVAVDLETLALARLVARQRALLHEVHRFAMHYGWSESEVLAVPPARRARYLALIEEQR